MKRNIYSGVGAVDPVKPVNPPAPIPTKYPPRRDEQQPVKRQTDEKPAKSFRELLEEEIEKNKANSSRRTNMSKPIKSAKLPKEVYYIVVNGSRQYYEDYDEADDNLETFRAIGKGKVDGVYTETDPDEIYELYEVGYIGNSRKLIKSGTSNFGSNDDVNGFSFPLVVYAAENYHYDEETDSETEERDYDADQWEYEDAMSEAESLADEMGIGFYPNNTDNYIQSDWAEEPFGVTIRDGYYEGIYIKVLEGPTSWWDSESEEDVPYDDVQMNDYADKINAYLDKLCNEYGWQKLGVSARFSNGETWYTKIDNSKKPVKSAVYRDDTGYANVANNFNSKVFDFTWFDTVGEDTTNYELFIDDFKNWLIQNGVNVEEYPNMDFDVGYYLKEFMNDPEADTTNALAMFQQVYDWVLRNDEFMTSDEYLDDMYGNTNFTDTEFFTEDIKENARKQWEEGDHHGFDSVEGIVKTAKELADRGYVECYDMYDAGGYGFHACDENNEWFETGCLFLGNGEEEYQLETNIPFDEEYDFVNLYNHFTINRDCIYNVSDRLYAYGIKWSDMEQEGSKLGLRSGM